MSYTPILLHVTFVPIMGADKLHDVRWLKSRPTPGGFTADNIDAATGIIRDVVMVQEGEARGHGVHLEAEFIRNLVAYDNATFGDRGVKARFGHPSASSETMGTQMGVFKNIRERKQDGKMQAIGDLHLMDSAEVSPTHPGMRSWMLQMAQENPEFVMSSIVFQASGYYQKKANGHRVPLKGDPNPDMGNVFVDFNAEAGAQHLYTDLVEEGAATVSLFSNQVNGHLFVAQADQFLYDHPELKQFIQANPEKITAFFGSLGISLSPANPATKPKYNMAFNLFSWLSGESQATEADLETIRTDLSAAQNQVTALAAARVAAENRATELETGNTALQSAVGALETQLSTATARIAELEELAAAAHTGGGGNPGGGASGEKTYHKHPLTKRFQN